MERQLVSAVAYLRAGKLFIPHRDQFDALLSQMRDCRVVLGLTEEHHARSRQLEKFYWGVCIDRISLHTGHTEDEAHALMKALHLPRRLHAHYGGDICWQCGRLLGGTTRRLSSPEYSTYVGNVQRWGATDLGLIIPDPNEELVAA